MVICNIGHGYPKTIPCFQGNILPQLVVTDNGKQFVSNSSQEFYKALGISLHMMSAEHPQTNGQVKATNKVILGELKNKIRKAKRLCIEELLVSYKHTIVLPKLLLEKSRSISHGINVMIPIEVGEPFVKCARYNEENNNQILCAERTSEARKKNEVDKLENNWEGLFRVKEKLEMELIDGKEVPRTWNATHLKFYFSLSK
ncbi:Gag-Pol polyprotein, partial [Mucuna pruriens]